jgi:SOS response regulatory protein OraA/RecX
LGRKGLAAETVEAATAGLDDAQLAWQAGSRQARRLHGYAWPDFRRRLYAYLSRRGFSAGVIGPVVTGLWQETTAAKSPIENEEVP